MPFTSGDILDEALKRGYIAPDDLKAIKDRASALGIPLLEAALLANRLHHDTRGWILAGALGIPFLEVEPDSVSAGLSELLPEAMARENRAVPIAREGDRLTVAVADPFLHDKFSVIEEMTGLVVRIVVCPSRTIGEILARLYPGAAALEPSELGEGAISREEAEEWLSLGGAKRLCEQVLLHATFRGMADIRLSPMGRDVAIEGRLGEKNVRLLSCPLRWRKMLLDAFRDLVGIPEDTDLPTEKIFHLESEAGVVAFQGSFPQGLSGPEVIVKILYDWRPGMSLDSLGFTPGQLEISRKMLGRGNGLFLVSSPAPEGVATTLFAMLREVHRPGRRVVTVEERHRFRNEGYVQLEHRQVRERFSRDWSRLAESLQPDILMIEQLIEPASLADLLQIAQGGTIVLAGIRRLNIDRAIRTLLTLDVDPFVLAHVTRLVLHQRVVKLLCMECRRQVPAKPSLLLAGERHREELDRIVRDFSFYFPAGCEKCAGTGYAGRMALIDLVPFTPGVQNIVAAESGPEEKLSKLLEEDFYSAAQSVYELLRRGMVTYEDVVPFFR